MVKYMKFFLCQYSVAVVASRASVLQDCRVLGFF